MKKIRINTLCTFSNVGTFFQKQTILVGPSGYGTEILFVLNIFFPDIILDPENSAKLMRIQIRNR
jgi:hypothetical protein